MADARVRELELQLAALQMRLGDADVKTTLEAAVLAELDAAGSIGDSFAFLAKQPVGDHGTLVNVIKSLAAASYVLLDTTDLITFQLTEEAKGYLANGSPEAQVFQAVGADGASREDIQQRLGNVFKIGFGVCMKRRLVKMDKKTGMLTRLADTMTDEVQELLKEVEGGKELPKKTLADMKKRKLVTQTKAKSYSIIKGAKFQKERVKQSTDITAEMVQRGDWEKADFKDYNFNAQGPVLRTGALHPVQKVRAEFRSILLNMGFSEMPTNNFVESSFWNFDALFQPQQHPARDSHDTFFLSKPELCNEFPADYCERVKKMHESGGNGSIGYRYDWKITEAKKNILRTHTTAVSSRMLYKVAQEGFKPCRYFSVDRVFRNESLDATHLAEFHQVEGLVCDRNLTLGDLIGTIETFFHAIGIEKLRFKPAFNPYTEPSMEIFGYSNELEKWIEIGNSGMFRPEMLTPMGMPDDVRVVAWGLSLERPTMIKYGINNIRDLFGPKVKLPIIQKNPIARFY